MKLFRIILSITLILLAASCSPEPSSDNGTLKVFISSGITKGITPNIDLDTANYRLVVADAENEETVFNLSDRTSAEASFPTGTYTAQVFAENAEGTVIGQSEPESFRIYPDKTTTVSLSVYEAAGNGTISLTFYGLDAFEDGTGFSVVFTSFMNDGSPEQVSSSVTIDEFGVGTASASLANGFYTFGLDSTDDAGDVQLIDAIRIVKDDKIELSYTYSYEGDGSIVIENNILPTPSIEIEADREEFPITISSAISNAPEAVTYAWYMDGEPLAGASEKDLVLTASSGISAGEHDFVLLILSDTGVIWASPKATVNVPESTTVIDLAGKDLDNGVEITISPDEEVMLSNVNIQDGVVVTILGEESSKGISTYDNNGKGKNVFKTQGGDFMPYPDKNMNAYFNGSNLGAKNNLRLKIKKFKNLESDFSINSEEYSSSPSGIFEEFYYVDFTDKRFADLDKSCIVVDETRVGACGYELFQYGMDTTNNKAMYNFEEYDGFGIYSYYIFSPSLYDRDHKISVYSANRITEDTELNGKSGVFQISPEDGNKVIFSLAEGIAENYKSLASPTHLRTTEGEYLDHVSIPVIDPNAKTVTFYLGDFEETILVNYYIDEEESISVSLSFAEENESPEVLEFSTIPSDGFNVVANGEDYITIPFVYDTDNDIYLNDTSHVTNLVSAKKSRAANYIEYNTYGYIVFNCTGIEEGSTLATLEIKEEKVWLDATHGVTDGTTKYILDGTDKTTNIGPYANTSFFGGYYSERLFDGLNENGDRIHEDYGLLSFNLLGGGISSSTIALPNSTIGNATSPLYGIFATSLIDTSLAVDMRIKEFWLEDKVATKILCDISIGNREDKITYENIYFYKSENSKHDWRFSEGKAICKNCQEERNMVTISLNAKHPKISFSGIKDIEALAEMHVPLTQSIFYFYNQIVEYGNLESLIGDNAFDVHIIAPTPNSTLSVTEIETNSFDVSISYY